MSKKHSIRLATTSSTPLKFAQLKFLGSVTLSHAEDANGNIVYTQSQIADPAVEKQTRNIVFVVYAENAETDLGIEYIREVSNVGVINGKIIISIHGGASNNPYKSIVSDQTFTSTGNTTTAGSTFSNLLIKEHVIFDSARLPNVITIIAKKQNTPDPTYGNTQVFVGNAQPTTNKSGRVLQPTEKAHGKIEGTAFIGEHATGHGVPVTLLGNDGSVNTTVTDANGRFLFNALSRYVLYDVVVSGRPNIVKTLTSGRISGATQVLPCSVWPSSASPPDQIIVGTSSESTLTGAP